MQKKTVTGNHKITSGLTPFITYGQVSLSTFGLKKQQHISKFSKKKKCSASPGKC